MRLFLGGWWGWLFTCLRHRGDQSIHYSWSRWCAQWVQWMENSGGESPWSIGSGGCLSVSLGAQNEKKAHTDGFSRMCAVIMCARKVPDCSLENRVPWSCFLIFIHGLLKRERVRESACMDDSYKSKGHLCLSFQSYQVSTCHAKFYTNTRVTRRNTISYTNIFPRKIRSQNTNHWSGNCCQGDQYPGNLVKHAAS